MLGAFGEITMASLASEFGRTKLDWAHRATGMWPEWLASLSPVSDGSDLLIADGTVVVLNAIRLPEVDTANFRAIRSALTEYGEAFEDVDPADVDWLDPEPTARPLQAMFLPREHAVDTHALLVRLEAAFLAAGGELVAQHVATLQRSGDRVDGVRLASGVVLAAGDVVLAAGAATQWLLDTLPDVAARIPRLASSAAVSAVVDSADGTSAPTVVRTPARAVAGDGVHVLPLGDGRLQIGSAETVTSAPQDTASVADVLSLLDKSARQIRRELGEAGLREIQVDNRPVAPDGLPLLGETDLDGLWMMTGTHRDGLTLSPLLATETAALPLGEQPSVDLEIFAPVRSTIEPLTRGEIVEATVTHLVAAGYEANSRTPWNGRGCSRPPSSPSSTATRRTWSARWGCASGGYVDNGSAGGRVTWGPLTRRLPHRRTLCGRPSCTGAGREASTRPRKVQGYHHGGSRESRLRMTTGAVPGF
jgi:glycine/D-amino acid oxidase-like deaminating enzyme